ncbi:MAG: hypothetical protein ACI4Q6_10550, partial [Huintestinicola sp.]
MPKKTADSSSIAGQIATHRQLERLGGFFLTDFLIIIFSALSWCIAQETVYFDVIDPRLPRALDFEYISGDFWSSVSTGVYRFGEYSVSCGDFSKMLIMGICGVGIIQAVSWLFSFLPEYFRAKKMLSPLNRMALTANELSDAAHQSAYNFDDIESAIGNLDPISS